MKKFLSLFLGLTFIIGSFLLTAKAEEMVVVGKGVAALSGYDIGYTRAQEDEYMSGKAHKTKTELMHDQHIKEASRQAEKRKKQDKRLTDAVRGAVVTTARERADKDAVNMLVEMYLGAGSTKNPKVETRISDIYSQVNTYAINKVYTGEVIDNNYIAKVEMTVDYDKFGSFVRQLGLDLNVAEKQAHNILLVMDEFFTAPSDMHSNTLTKEVTTYAYNYSEKDKESTKLSAKDSSSSKRASGYSGYYGQSGSKAVSSSNSSLNYGNYVDYSKDESEFFQNVREYAPKNPKVNNMNLTRAALAGKLTKKNISLIDERSFRNTFFKNQTVNSDTMQNHENLDQYIEFARNNAHADYFAIGMSYITDNGTDANTGLRAASGVVYLEIFSTKDKKVLTAGKYEDSDTGDTADMARSKVAGKIADGLAGSISRSIQEYYNDRKMYGNDYTVQVKGDFLPAERISINKALKTAEGVQNVSLRTNENTLIECTLNYHGDEPVADTLFMKLLDVSPKFNNYDYSLNGNQIIFKPLKGK